MSEHACTDGWIYETVEGRRTVKDRCMICNEPPWYRVQRRRQMVDRFWPLIFLASLIAIQFGLIEAIYLYQRFAP